MWYGFKRDPNIPKLFQNSSNRLNRKNRRFGKPLKRFSIYPPINFMFQIPANWNFILLRPLNRPLEHTLIYSYNDVYYFNFILRLDSPHLRYDRQTRTVQIQSFTTAYNYLWYLKTLSTVLRRFHKPFFTKIKFKGKGYYVYKNTRNTIAPQFNYAHRVYVYAFTASVRFLSKTKIFIFGLSKQNILSIAHGFKRTRPINIFTGRGVRFARQIIYRKTGKIGAYR